MNEHRASAIISTGAYLPANIVENHQLVQFPPASLALIGQKTGVQARRFAAADETTSDLAIKAARVCLARCGIAPEAIDAIVLATSSPDRIQPATAARVQSELGAVNAFAFDINSVCSGGLFALQVADSFIKSEYCGNVLVIAAELYSRFLNPKDFATYPYFGDGAGAILLGRATARPRILGGRLKTNGAGGELIQIPAGGSKLPAASSKNLNDFYFKMNGREVYAFATAKGAEIVEELIAGLGLDRNKIGFIVSHQANINILKELSAQLKIPFGKFVVNLDRYGNTAAASVLLGLDQIFDGASRNEELVVLVAFGGGLSWGAIAIQL